MNDYDVVCITGRSCYILKTIHAKDEYHAKKLMWDRYLDEQQKKNCLDVLVYKTNETN